MESQREECLEVCGDALVQGLVETEFCARREEGEVVAGVGDIIVEIDHGWVEGVECGVELLNAFIIEIQNGPGGYHDALYAGRDGPFMVNAEIEVDGCEQGGLDDGRWAGGVVSSDKHGLHGYVLGGELDVASNRVLITTQCRYPELR